jgi:hypothetical protein
MNRNTIWIAVGVMGLWPQIGRTAVISHDWKIPGDGLLTYDDVNQREWLDLTQSRLAQFPGATVKERYQSLLPELSAGRQFDGFFAANSADVSALATSAGIDLTNFGDFGHNEGPTTFLMNLVGVSVSFDNVQSYGLLNEMGMVGPIIFQTSGILSVSPDSGPNGRAGLILGMLGDLAVPGNTGAWLYRAVPEVASGYLAALGLSVTYVIRRLLRRSRSV